LAIHIGTSGWSYPHWDGVLYPPGTSSAGRLDVYTKRFDTVELNASFYHWPRDTGFASWRQRLPAGFQLSVKAPRGLTHGRRLREPEVWVDRISSCWHTLGDRRGVLLVQLAPADERDDARLDYFLSHVPSWIRVAMEFRHSSWHDEQVFSLLERHGTAYCVMSGAALPCILRATSDFVYLRLHGPDSNTLYAGSYTSDDLRWWADRIREWAADGKDIYAYFNNDGNGHAVRNADYLRDVLGT
jgi:uncharacterized protein YecE (DUF72 family)